MTRLDEKLARIRAGQYRKSDFIIADAKDADMGSGITGLGPKRKNDGTSSRYRTRDEFESQIRSILDADIVDIMLVSSSILERLMTANAFAKSGTKPAIRANDTTDCWGAIRHGSYAGHPSRPFRTANLQRVMYGTLTSTPEASITGTDLGLYSVTFVNDIDIDTHALNEFAKFRDEAGLLGFKYFLEVFNPNVSTGLDARQTAEFVNDCILRCLAGVMEADRPQFLKIPFNGPRAMEELASFDSKLIVGVLGGGAGTTRDAFELIAQAEKYGARLALFGRKINLAESQELMITYLRRVVEGEVRPAEAVRAYHGDLEKMKILPHRSLSEDIEITEAPLKEGAISKAA
ncbi:hypothetical protein [Chelativorans sp. M5D2P16]|uniref:hypothetical protein n=1 Tax=Chelativorans sp. M5D2P16 TaxID=3095678 RepID=UPI002ACA0F77|nr:hypothetical protein [Chelativorans sp. M5D2P16]MDZ5698663.1 hypothetical protein [Chelativorans sp. M5D2P16]